MDDTLGGDVGTLNTWCLLLPSAIPPTEFVRGDVNEDLAANTSDVIFILNAIFTPGSPQPGCEDAADVDDSGTINILDPIRILGSLFLGSAGPEAPFPSCGDDPTADDPFFCLEFSSCP